MAAQLLAEAISEYQQSLQGISEALTASPDEQELLELKSQLEGALLEAQATLEGLQSTDTPPASVLAGIASSSAAAAPPPTARPRNAAPGSSNARIHSRSKYAYQKPDFRALAARYPSMLPFLASKGGVYDFTDPAACRELTHVLLAEDFGIQWWLPLGQLVPPVTNRVNYIHWLEDLLSLSKPEGPVTGLDIGCGANLIYPLLGAVLCGWSFVGADVTAAALRWAARNLGANPHLAQLIEVRRVAMQQEQQQFLGADSDQGGDCAVAAAAYGDDGDLAADELAAELADAPEAVAAAPPGTVVHLEASQAAGSGIVSGAVRHGERYAFCMCNPPFFESIEDAGRNPSTAFGGTAAEMVYPGGELAFLTAMVQDSLKLRGAVHWYTSMVGKKGTLRAVRSMLYRHGVRVLRTTEFFQGKTSRWALAWSFTADAAAASKPLPRFPAAGTATAQVAQPASGGHVLQAQPAAQVQAAAAAAAAAARPVSRKLSWQVHAPASASAALYDVALTCLQRAGVTCESEKGTFVIRGSYDPTTADHAEPATGDAPSPSPKRQRVGDGAHGKPRKQPTGWRMEVHLFQQHAGLFLLTATLHKSAPESALGWWGALSRRLQDDLSAKNWKVTL
ncbi:U6 small nuclear RNA (adenine-(43)-N(6))-methyltransferase [Chlorella vulgaris]